MFPWDTEAWTVPLLSPACLGMAQAYTLSYVHKAGMGGREFLPVTFGLSPPSAEKLRELLLCSLEL